MWTYPCQDRESWMEEKKLTLKGKTVADKVKALQSVCIEGRVGVSQKMSFLYCIYIYIYSMYRWESTSGIHGGLHRPFCFWGLCLSLSRSLLLFPPRLLGAENIGQRCSFWRSVHAMGFGEWTPESYSGQIWRFSGRVYSEVPHSGRLFEMVCPDSSQEAEAKWSSSLTADVQYLCFHLFIYMYTYIYIYYININSLKLWAF